MKLNITENGNEEELLTLLAWVELCGEIGHSPISLKVRINGKNSSKWKFQLCDESFNETYQQIKQCLQDNLKKKYIDLGEINL